MSAAYQLAFVYPAAFALLPPEMESPEARALMIAIGFQESGFSDRYQVLDSGVKGAGRGFYQFELGGGVAGVLAHPSTRAIALHVLNELHYPPDARSCYVALEHSDILAACFARLLLWTDSEHLPGPHAATRAWKIYERLWRPGKPHPDAFPAHFAQAWSLVDVDGE